MKVSKQFGNVSAEFEAKTQCELFEQFAEFGEVFGIQKCEKCGKTDIKHVVRTVEDNPYYELRCNNNNCRAKLAFGKNKNGGTLFPKRKDGEGNWKPNNGWTTWNAKTEKEE